MPRLAVCLGAPERQRRECDHRGLAARSGVHDNVAAAAVTLEEDALMDKIDKVLDLSEVERRIRARRSWRTLPKTALSLSVNTPARRTP